MSSNPSTSSCFVEIGAPSPEEEALPERIECYVLVDIDPRCCGPLARDLNALFPLRRSAAAAPSRPSTNGDETPPSAIDDGRGGGGVVVPRTDHLKRIRRRPATADELGSRSRSEAMQERLTNGDNGTPDVSQGGEKGSAKNGNGNKPNEGKGEHPPKRSKPNKKSKKLRNSSPWSLDLLVGSVAAVDQSIRPAGSSNSTQSSLASVLEKHSLLQSSNLARRHLPGRPARNRCELDEWNKSAWPTLFFEEKTAQHKKEQLALTDEEVEMMKRGMREALEDARMGQRQWKEWNSTLGNREATETMPPIEGVVVMNPVDGSFVARASEERRVQEMPENSDADGGSTSDAQGDEHAGQCSTCSSEVRGWSSFPDEANPLCTPTLLAIQGVSRRERRAALGCGMESEEFKGGQYLCTGYDVYLTKEPSAYEAMALVHSRVRRVVFGIRDEEMGGLGGAGRNAGIHSLPGTNHHYRAFRLDAEGADGVGRDEAAAALVGSLRVLHDI